MTDPIKFAANGNQPEPRSVELFDKKFTLRRVTRSVQIELEKAQRELNALIARDEDESVTADALVACFAEAVDALLKPDEHRTAAKKIIGEKWQQDEITLAEIRGFADQLQEDAAAERPS